MFSSTQSFNWKEIAYHAPAGGSRGDLHADSLEVSKSGSLGIRLADVGVLLLHLPESSGIVRVGSQIRAEIDGGMGGRGGWGSQDEGSSESGSGEDLSETHFEDEKEDLKKRKKRSRKKRKKREKEKIED